MLNNICDKNADFVGRLGIDGLLKAIDERDSSYGLKMLALFHLGVRDVDMLFRVLVNTNDAGVRYLCMKFMGEYKAALSELLKINPLRFCYDVAYLSKRVGDGLCVDLFSHVFEKRMDLTLPPAGNVFFDDYLGRFGDARYFWPSLREKIVKHWDEKDVVLAGITKIKNEGKWGVDCILNLSMLCDQVFVCDDGSVDQLLETKFPDNVFVYRRDNDFFDEQDIYEGLFRSARAKGATHMMMLDADERLDASSADELKQLCTFLPKGSSLVVDWHQVVGEGIIDYDWYTSHVGHITKFLPPKKDLIYCDDGAARHRPMRIHNSFIPAGYPNRRVRASRPAIYHYDKTSIDSVRIKHDWYLLREATDYKTEQHRIFFRYASAALLYHRPLTKKKDGIPNVSHLPVRQSEQWRVDDCLRMSRLERAKPITPFLFYGWQS